MSYTRWSTEITGFMSFENQLDLMRRGYSWTDTFEVQKEMGEISDWYIFWHCDSGDTVDDQVLSLWHTCCDTKNYDYLTVKQMYEDDDFGEDLEEVMTQREHMRACVRDWLDGVEEDYPE